MHALTLWTRRSRVCMFLSAAAMFGESSFTLCFAQLFSPFLSLPLLRLPSSASRPLFRRRPRSAQAARRPSSERCRDFIFRYPMRSKFSSNISAKCPREKGRALALAETRRMWSAPRYGASAPNGVRRTPYLGSALPATPRHTERRKIEREFLPQIISCSFSSDLETKNNIIWQDNLFRHRKFFERASENIITAFLLISHSFFSLLWSGRGPAALTSV